MRVASESSIEAAAVLLIWLFRPRLRNRAASDTSNRGGRVIWCPSRLVVKPSIQRTAEISDSTCAKQAQTPMPKTSTMTPLK